MENIIYKGAINSLSFGNVSYNILREFFRKNITVAFFPYGENLNFEAFDKIDKDLQQWIVSSSQNRFHLIDKDYPTLSQWHLNGSETRVSRRQFLYTAHETDSVTNIEKSIALMQDRCIFNSNHSVENFKDSGCSNIDFVPLGFDEDFSIEGSSGFTDKIHFGLMGKFEKRKNTAQILRNWAAQYGNNYDYQLSCCINNNVIKPDQLNQLIHQALDGKQYGNINFLPHLKTNSEVNTFLNSIDIDLSGLSGAEGWNLPAFNATALGKWSIVLNCTAHKDWANKSNSILIEPDSQEEIYDQMFFIKGQAFNQGNMNLITDETMIKALKSAEKKAKKENKEGLKLQSKFTYEKTVNQLLNIIQNEK